MCFCVILCVSVPCDKPLCGWSGLPCGWGTLLCGWGYSYFGRGKSPRSCSGLPSGKGHAELCSTSDLQVHVVVDVYIFRYRPAHEAFVDQRNSIPYGKGTSRCHCTAVYMKHCVSYMQQTVVWGSVAHDSSLFREITQLQYASCMKHTVVSWPFPLGHAYIRQRKLWFLCTLQFLLRRRHHCKHKQA